MDNETNLQPLGKNELTWKDILKFMTNFVIILDII
jgi:hypothetical protein